MGFAHDLPPEHLNPIISVYPWVEPTLQAAEFLIQHYPPSFPRRRESIGNFKKQIFEKQFPKFKKWIPAYAGMTT
ncbi:hypothetical protein [Neisseria mucosa]|uniref:hypothetical protein n=1 Tax=Neisseria mucosa TaxID=488 RepID=UPI0027E1BF5B|nr:hypothetical protein [Neisseria mucosa]